MFELIGNKTLGMFDGKPLYDIAKDFGLPAAVAVVGILLTVTQLYIESKRIEQRIYIEDRRIQQAVLNNYQNQILTLIGDTNLKDIWNDAANNRSNSFSQMAPAYTRAILKQLHSDDKKQLLSFLIELDMLERRNSSGYSPVTLEDVDFSSGVLNGLAMKGADLRYANLSYTQVVKTDFSNATLNEVKLKYSTLRNVNATSADFSGADFELSEVSDVDFSNANLSGVSFKYVRFKNVIWEGANLSDADFTGSIGANPEANGFAIKHQD
jgi:uncharacterized protein YjbI with pentapeptide repeats